jgi:hypothetical protein
MANDYKLLMETPETNLSRIMKQINGVYAQRCNRRQQRVHLFQVRFKSINLDKDACPLALCRYTELDPVRAGLIDAPGRYRWSSFRAAAGMIKPPDVLSTNWISSQHPKTCPQAPVQYRRFV